PGRLVHAAGRHLWPAERRDPSPGRGVPESEPERSRQVPGAGSMNGSREHGTRRIGLIAFAVAAAAALALGASTRIWHGGEAGASHRSPLIHTGTATVERTTVSSRQ